MLIIEQLFICADIMITPDLTATIRIDPETCDVFQSDATRVAGVKRALISSRDLVALAETFKILGDPTRVRLLDALSKAELCVCDLASLLGLSESAISHQLRLLRGTRVVRARRDGRMVFYSLDDQHILSLFQQGLRHVEEASSAAGRGRQALPGSGRTPGSSGTSSASADETPENDLPRRGAWE
jgi:ArsR family transcriptional regulator, lead/cadmium/zinc/bismuth-responsive transcriptional repressor